LILLLRLYFGPSYVNLLPFFMIAWIADKGNRRSIDTEFVSR
jgi:hypothetical protein